MIPEAKSALVKSIARTMGFDRVGVAAAAPTANADRYRSWLGRGYGGTMAYLGRNVPMRENAANLLDGARSVICCAVLYRREDEDASGATDGPRRGDKTSHVDEPSGRVAQYARGADYHVVLRRRLEALIAALREAVAEPFEARACVDTAPILERDLAAAAGLGWIGKNTLLLHESLGSFLFLGEIITTLNLSPDVPATDHCGTCTRCLDACPTDAFPQPYVLDARRCISYLTIEHRGEIDDGLKPLIGEWVYGCDVCQDVCPFNRKAPLCVDAELREERIAARVPLAPLVQLTSGGYRRLTRGTAATRATRGMWRRNATIAEENARRAPGYDSGACAEADGPSRDAG